MDNILGSGLLGESGDAAPHVSINNIVCNQTVSGNFYLSNLLSISFTCNQTLTGNFFLSSEKSISVICNQGISGNFYVVYAGAMQIPAHIAKLNRTSVTRFCSALTNVFSHSTLSSDNVLPSLKFRKKEVNKSGFGTVSLSGEWRGKKDGIIEVSIIENQGSGYRFIQNKKYIGTGNGDIEVSFNDFIEPQSITLSCVKNASNREFASIEFLGVELKAKASGKNGNRISINSTQQIALTKSPFSLLEDLNVGENDHVNDEWNFGGLMMSNDGLIPSDTVRFCIGNDKTVYRQYRTWENNEWHYKITPPPRRNYSSGELIYYVNGNYHVEITDGIIGESHYGITAFDIFSSIQATSNICRLDGRLQKDLSPNGIGLLDFPFKTNPYYLKQELIGENTKPITELVIKTRVSEKLSIVCVENTVTGKEQWRVSGMVHGTMGMVQTGAFFNGLHYQFQMPDFQPEKQKATGVFGHKFEPVDRTDDETSGDACLLGFTLGTHASDKEITFVYKKRTTSALNAVACETGMFGKISGECLGLSEDIKEMGEIPEQLNSRLMALLELGKAITELNTEVVSDSLTVYRVVYSEFDVEGTDTEVVLRPQSKDDDFGVRQHKVKFPLFKFQPFKTLDFTRGIDADLFVSEYLDRFKFYFEQRFQSTSYNPWMGNQTYTSAFTRVSADPFIVKIPLTRGGHSVPSGRTAFKAKDLNLSVANKFLALMQTTLMQVYESPDGLTEWDAMWFDMQSVIANTIMSGSDTDDIYAYNENYLQRFESRRDIALLKSGIIPKNDGSTQKSGQCWVDKSLDFWWISEDGYMPAFSNSSYISTRRGSDGVPYSTKEFGFYLSVTGAAKVGDKITIKIEGAKNSPVYYQLGDAIEIPIICSSPINLSGGRDDDPSFEWVVHSSKQGILPTLTAPTYSNNGININLINGVIPFSIGDSFSFSISDLQSSIVIDNKTPTIGDIKTTEINGAIIDYIGDLALGDYHKIIAMQENSYLNVANTKETFWQWNGIDATISSPCLSPIDTIIIVHSLPANSRVYVELSKGDDGVIYSEEIPYKPRIMGLCENAPIDCDLVTIKIENAGGGKVQWIYAGYAVRTTNNAQSFSLQSEFAMYVGGGINPRKQYRGSGRGGKIEWENWLFSDDVELVNLMISDLKRRGEFCVVIPNKNHDDFFAGVLDDDSFEVSDYFNYQTSDKNKRRQSQSLNFKGVLK
jgi:hypothetical protein